MGCISLVLLNPRQAWIISINCSSDLNTAFIAGGVPLRCYCKSLPLLAFLMNSGIGRRKEEFSAVFSLVISSDYLYVKLSRLVKSYKTLYICSDNYIDTLFRWLIGILNSSKNTLDRNNWQYKLCIFFYQMSQ